MKGIKIYIEGGGDTRKLQTPLRIGFQMFLSECREAAKAKNLSFKVVMCGGRKEAYDDFKTSIAMNPDFYSMLLVDSEAPVGTTRWEHLEKREGDHWDQAGEDDQCHLMVQCMETWFVADVEALKKVFPRDLDETKLPQNSNLEEAEKDDVLDKLNKATYGKYHKRNKAKEILEVLNPATIRQLKHCGLFFDTLETKIASL